ncbi:MAG: complex I NDUFA9 subunit family protein [Chloroflexota bacterium]|nr:complex I NDUFA9 subunit family protein [Chloroflexota bacterium]
MATVLVTGASGFVASYVIPALLDAGHRVRALVRNERGRQDVLRRLPEGRHGEVEFRFGDVTEPQGLAEAVAGADAVVHLVAIPRDFSAGRDLERINVGGTVNVIEAMKRGAVRRLIYLGNMGIANDPTLKFASSKARAEAAVAGSGLEWTILKPSTMFGERDGFFNIIADLARRLPLVRFNPGIVPMPGLGRARFQPIWVGDVARVAALCLERPDTVGRSLELGGPRYWTYREIVEEVLRGMGARRLILPVPVPVIWLVARIYETLKVYFPTATDQLRQLRLDNIGPLTLIRDEFGFEPRQLEGQLGYLKRKSSEQ